MNTIKDIIKEIAACLGNNNRGNLCINKDEMGITINRDEALFSKIGPTTEAGPVKIKVLGPPFICILTVYCTIDEVFDVEDVKETVNALAKNEEYCDNHYVDSGYPVSVTLQYKVGADDRGHFSSNSLNEMLNECLDAAKKIENDYWIE